MTVPKQTGDNRLPVLAAEICKAHAEVQAAGKTAIERAIQAGHALIEAKGLLKHGEWLPWLRAHCNISERMAQRYVRLARNRATIETKSDTKSDLSISGALALLTLPRDSADPSDRVTAAAVESLFDSQDGEDALRSVSERRRRAPLLNAAKAKLDRIAELVALRPSLATTVEAIGEHVAEEFLSACSAYETAVITDLHDPAYNLARKIHHVACEWLRGVEANFEAAP